MTDVSTATRPFGRRRPGGRPAAVEVPCSSRSFRATHRRHGAIPERGLRPGGNCVTGSCWSGSRTRDRQIPDLLLYPTELSSGERAGFEPATGRRTVCSTSELSSSRNIFVRSSAYAAAMPGAPDGTREPVPLRTADRHFALPPVARRQFVWACARACAISAHSPPVPKHPGTALARRRSNRAPASSRTAGCSGAEQESRIFTHHFLCERQK